jgi:hypothetical protein
MRDYEPIDGVLNLQQLPHELTCHGMCSLDPQVETHRLDDVLGKCPESALLDARASLGAKMADQPSEAGIHEATKETVA